MAGIETVHETVETADGPMVLSIAFPTSAPRGGVVLVQEAFGVNDHIEDVGRRLAGAGYVSVAPHVYHRSGDPVVGYTDYEQILPHIQHLTEGGILDDVDAALARLRRAGIEARSAGIVGFCMGGTISFLTAVRRSLGAAVTFYGGGVGTGRFGLPPLVELAPELKTPWLGLYGDKDQGIPVADVEKLREQAASAKVDTEIVRYADAGHGFHCDVRGDYHEPSATDAWARALQFFDAHLAH